MEAKKFLQQVYNKINKQENPAVILNDDCIEIAESDKVIFKIDGKGSMFYSADKRLSNVVDKLCEEIQTIVRSVDEYLNAMENAPTLKARDFNMPYKKLAEFNGVVLGGTEHESTGEFEFATWDYCHNIKRKAGEAVDSMESSFRKERIWNISTRTMSVAVMLAFLLGRDGLHCS